MRKQGSVAATATILQKARWRPRARNRRSAVAASRPSPRQNASHSGAGTRAMRHETVSPVHVNEEKKVRRSRDHDTFRSREPHNSMPVGGHRVRGMGAMADGMSGAFIISTRRG